MSKTLVFKAHDNQRNRKGQPIKAQDDLERNFRSLYKKHGITQRGTTIALKNYRRDHGDEYNEEIAMKHIDKLKKGKARGQMTSYMSQYDQTKRMVKGKDEVIVTRGGRSRSMREEIADRMSNSKNPTERQFYELAIDKGLSPGEALRAFSDYQDAFGRNAKWYPESAYEFIVRYT